MNCLHKINFASDTACNNRLIIEFGWNQTRITEIPLIWVEQSMQAGFIRFKVYSI